MNKVHDHIRKRRIELQEQRDGVLGELRNLEAELPLIDAKIEEIDRLLKGFPIADSSANHGPHEAALIPPAVAERVRNGHRPGTTAAIFDYLKSCEAPVRPVTVVNAVVERIATRSQNPRRMVFNTLFNLGKSGKLEKTSTGRVRLPR